MSDERLEGVHVRGVGLDLDEDVLGCGGVVEVVGVRRGGAVGDAGVDDWDVVLACGVEGAGYPCGEAGEVHSVDCEVSVVMHVVDVGPDCV